MAHHDPTHDEQKPRTSWHVTGPVHEIPRHPDQLYPRTTLAAGAVLWRGTPSDPASVEVAVIHRPYYDDWSLAKGKVDPGETLSTTVAREVLEETGYQVQLGSLVGHVTYPVAGRTKVVFYWTAEVIGGEFNENEEVDEMRWVSFEQARSVLSYDVDVAVLERAQELILTPIDTRVLLTRHARAHDRGKWAGDDNLRPLDKKGRRQSEMLVPMLLPYQPQQVLSASPDRCVHTATPLADELGLATICDEALDDITWIASPDSTKERISELSQGGGVSVVVSQGTAIPGILEWLFAEAGMAAPEEFKVKKSSVWVLSFADGRLVTADYLASPLPIK